MKIAVVEDDQPIAKMYETKLKLAGYDVQVAHNGSSGFDLLKQFSPDLVLLDIRMPEVSGDEMLEKVRSTDWGSGILVIILTNISKDEAPSSLRLLGIERYIVKAHHTPAQVLEIVNEVLSIKQKRAVR